MRTFHIKLLLSAILVTGVQCAPNLRLTVICGALASLMLRNRESNSSEEVLVFAVSILGFAPFLGWFGGINKSVDVVVLFCSVAIAHGLVELIKRKKAVNFAAVVSVLSAVVTYTWWRPLTKGTKSDLLSRLISGWDHFGHYYLMISAKVNSKYVSLLPNLSPDSTAYGRKYPAGIHMSWAQWWRDLDSELLNQPSVAISQYFISVILTTCICTGIIIYAISRVPKSNAIRDLSAISCAIVFLSFVCFGHLSMAIWSGFPNFIVAITGVIILISIAMRPPESSWITLLISAGAAATTTYNWYPLVVPVIPIVLFILWKKFLLLQQRNRILFLFFALVFGVFISIPIFQALSFGAGHLAIPGGINSLPAHSIVLVLLLGISVAIFHASNNPSVQGLVEASPLVLAVLFQVLVSLPIRIQDGTYPYYPQKIAYGMVFLILSMCIMLLFQRFDKSWFTLNVRTKFLQSFALLIVSLSFSQLFGYVGPDSTVFAGGNTAPGMIARDAVMTNSISKHRISTILLGLEEAVRHRPYQAKECLVLNDTEMQDYDPVLINYWVGTLTWTLTEEHLLESQKLIPLRTGKSESEVNAKVIASLLSPLTDCPVVPRTVADLLANSSPQWAKRLWVIESDGHVTRFVGEG